MVKGMPAIGVWWATEVAPTVPPASVGASIGLAEVS